MKFIRIAILAAMAGASAAANAAVSSYTDLASFSTAAGTLNIETFNSFQSEPSFQTTAVSLGGGAFQVLGFGNQLDRNYIDLPPAQFAAFNVDGTTIMNSFVTTTAGFEFTFAAPITAFGFDFGAMQNNSLRTVITVAGTALTPSQQAGDQIGFYGFVSDTAFTTIRFTGNDNDGFGIDNIRWASAATPGVPEPASWAMLIAGFGLVGAATRRRRAAAIG